MLPEVLQTFWAALQRGSRASSGSGLGVRPAHFDAEIGTDSYALVAGRCDVGGFGVENISTFIAPDDLIPRRLVHRRRRDSEAVGQVAAKDRPARLNDLRLETLPEGLCVQSLHIGSYDNETELLRQMHHEFIPASQGLTMVAKHHEIYLSDARKVEPAKLKTILRQPVATQ